MEMQMPRQNKATLSRRERKLRERTSSHVVIMLSFKTGQTGTLLCNTALLLCNTAWYFYSSDAHIRKNCVIVI